MKDTRVAASFALLALAGCAQILDLHDRSAAPLDADTSSVVDASPVVDASLALVAGQCGGLLHPSASCASCMDQACCSEARACAGDAACQEAATCLASCADDACRAQCAEFTSVPNTLSTLRACRVQHCADSCGSTCGEIASPIPACDACERGGCCAQAAACESNAACDQLSVCLNYCFGAASCPTACQSAFPLGVDAYTALSTCELQCGTACQSGQSWACLNSPIAWPKPASGSRLTFSVSFVNFTAELPFVGSTVKACDKLDYACSSLLGQSVTDATGLVSFSVAVGPNGFDGYLEITGGTIGGTATGATAFPTLWYPLPFVVADGWRGRTVILDAVELQTLTAATGQMLDPTRGSFAINALDCAMTPASGVSFSIDIADAHTVGYYLINGVPVTTATATDSSGIGAFLNLPVMVPSRLAVVHATAGVDGGESVGALSFVIRPGTITTGSSFPPIP